MTNLLGTSIASLQSESNGAISVYKKTLEKLSKVNEKAATQIQIRVEKAKVLETEIESLDKLTKENENFINKLRGLFE